VPPIYNRGCGYQAGKRSESRLSGRLFGLPRNHPLIDLSPDATGCP
jgi:hypothetical protein